MTTVHFHNVGRDKKSWSEDFAQVTEAALEKSVRKNGRLMSSNIDCVIGDAGAGGLVLVGGWRPVGSFAISQPQPVPA